MLLEGKIKLEITQVDDWTEKTGSLQDLASPLRFQPTSYTWVDVTEGLISADITRGVTEYEGPWSQIAPGQLIVSSRNELLDPVANPGLAEYGHKIRILADDVIIFSGKIRDVSVEYFNEWDPQVITINAFDAMQQLIDYSYNNADAIQGLDDVEPEDNVVNVNLGTVWRRLGMGPEYSFDTVNNTWSYVTKVEPGYNRLPGYYLGNGQYYTGYQLYQYKEGDIFGLDQDWHPRVFLDPYNLQGWGSSAIRNVTNIQNTEGGTFTPLTIPASYDDTYFGAYDSNNQYPNMAVEGKAWDLRHATLIDSSRPGIGDPNHPLYTDNIANPNNPDEGPTLVDTPFIVDAVSYVFGTLAGGHAERRAPYNGGFVAGVTDTNTNFVDMLLRLEQSEQGFMYVSAKDDIFILNRSQVHNAERDKYLSFASDGSASSYKRVKVIDGVKNIVNKLIITNTIYDTQNAVESEYQNENHLAYDNGDELRLMTVPGSPYKAYELDTPNRNLDNVVAEVIEFEDEQSIQRYGERALNLETSYAWGLEETYGSQANDVVWYGIYGSYATEESYVDPRDGGSSGNWRFIKFIRNDDNTISKEVWNSSKSYQYPWTEVYNRNFVARANELKSMIIDEYATPQREIQSIAWEVTDDTELAGAARTDIFDKIDINHAYNGVAFNKEYRVMGITHRIDLNRWEIEYQVWNQQGQP